MSGHILQGFLTQLQKISYNQLLERIFFSWMASWKYTLLNNENLVVNIYFSWLHTDKSCMYRIFWLWNPFFFLHTDLPSSLISLIPYVQGFQDNVFLKFVKLSQLFSTALVHACYLKQLIQETRSVILCQFVSSSIWTEKCLFDLSHRFHASSDFSLNTEWKSAFSVLLFLDPSICVCPIIELGVRAL